jgi:hypothetical protein
MPIFGTLAFVWALSFTTFLCTLNSGYWKGFLSFETGTEYCIRFFKGNAGDDEKQIAVFSLSMIKWEPIAAEVRAWTKQHYSRWKVESPSWFTKGLIAGIPDDYMPPDEVTALNERSTTKRRLTLDQMDVTQRIQTVVEFSLVEQNLELAEAGPIRPGLKLASWRQESFRS